MADPIPADALPMPIADGTVKAKTPEHIALVKLFNALRPDQRMDLRNQFKAHGYIPGAAIRRMLGLASLANTTDTELS